MSEKKEGSDSMTYYLWLKQRGEGCDYTIGCGHKVVRLMATTIEEARAAARRTLDDYGIGSEEREVDIAQIVAAVEDVMPLVTERVDLIECERAENERTKKLAQLEKLKRELGQ